jgi:hypothetical protein
VLKSLGATVAHVTQRVRIFSIVVLLAGSTSGHLILQRNLRG